MAVMGLTLVLLPLGGTQGPGGVSYHFPDMKVSSSAQVRASPDCSKTHCAPSQKPCCSGTMCAAGGITLAGSGIGNLGPISVAEAFVLPERGMVAGVPARPQFEPPRVFLIA